VGVVCFAITVHIMFNFARNLYYSSIDQGRPEFTIYEMSEEEFKNTPKHDANGADRQLPMVNITKAFIDRLYSMKLPAMKEIHGIVLIMKSNFEFDDNTPQPKTYLATFAQCSPRRYHYLGYRSAITGERIPELNEGDVLITDDLRDKVFGKGVDPRGFRILTEIDGSQRTIRDVVNISERLEDFYNNAVIFDRYAAHAEPPVTDYVPHRHVSRILNGHMHYIHHFKYPCQMVHKLLGAGADDDLIPCADHPS
jgi:hypothetical protein